MYEVGMYAGSFNPFHMGHLKCILQASVCCKQLHIIISEGKKRGEVDIKMRYRWVYLATKHLPHVKIHIISDDAESKAAYTPKYWVEDANKIKQMINQSIDVIFCGDDYKEGNNFYKMCYPESKLIYLHRDQINSTDIRKNPYKYWDWLPQMVKPYYTKKVLLVGGESTGKSTLTISLAQYYQAGFIEEAGRTLSEKSGTDLMMLSEDFTEILLTHKLNEMKAIEQGYKILFEDTDAMVTKFYNYFLEVPEEDRKKNSALADAIIELNHYDLILFLEPDVDFIQDGGRSIEIKNNREKYSNQIKSILDEAGAKYICITGDYQSRFSKVTKLIDQLICK